MGPTAVKTKNRNGRQTLSRAALRLQSDERLVALARSGSESAFEAIVERYRRPLVGYSRRLLGPDRAQDVVQQVFINAHAALLNDDRSIRLRPWLYRIAHNASVNVLKKNGSGDEQLDENYDGVPRPPEIAEQRHRLQVLFRQISDLPERQRAALLLRELEGRSYEEIAGEMGATVPIVRELLYRARVRLRNGCGALIPLSWLQSFASAGSGSQRLAQVVEGVPAGAGLVKLVAAVMVAGAVTGGVALTTSRNAASQHIAPAVVSPTDTSVTAASADLREPKRTQLPSWRSQQSVAPEARPQAPGPSRGSADEPAASSVEGEVAADEGEDGAEEDTTYHTDDDASPDRAGDETDEADEGDKADKGNTEAGDLATTGKSGELGRDILVADQF